MPEFRRAIVIEPFMPGVPNSSIQFEKGCERPSTKSALFTSGSGSLSLAKLIQIDFFLILFRRCVLCRFRVPALCALRNITFSYITYLFCHYGHEVSKEPSLETLKPQDTNWVKKISWQEQGRRSKQCCITSNR